MQRILLKWLNRIEAIGDALASPGVGGILCPLDVLIGAITYAVSYGEADLTSGELMIRIMTAVLLANGIVGGPDVMLYWRESGRRIEAERKLDEERKLLAEARKERDEAVALIRRLEEQLAQERQRSETA